MAGLPDDTCLEILSWLPAKQIARLRTLCRSVRAASHSRHFKLSQARHAIADAGVFVCHYDGLIEMILADNSSGVPPACLEFLNSSRNYVIGSNGGIIVLLQQEGPDTSNLILYNPVLQEKLPLGRPADAELRGYAAAGAVVLYGEGNDLDVVCISSSLDWNSFAECWLYSSRQKRWKLVSNEVIVGPRNVKFHRPVAGPNGFVFLVSDNGIAHRSEPYIVAINVHDGSSKLLEVPEEIRSPSNEWEIEIGGPGRNSFLSLVLCNQASEFTIWDMKDWDQWVWEKRELKASMASMELEPRPVGGFSLVNGETLIFAAEDAVYVYELNGGGGLKQIASTQGKYPYLCPYANTLQPCGESDAG